jgi:hypothetical protein
VLSVVKMCRWMEVSRSGFYEWRNAPESATAKRRGILALYVRKSFVDSDDTYGYRRVHVDLRGARTRSLAAELGFYAARSYSLMSPPRTGRRWIRSRARSATGWSGKGGWSRRLRWGRRPL